MNWPSGDRRVTVRDTQTLSYRAHDKGIMSVRLRARRLPPPELFRRQVTTLVLGVLALLLVACGDEKPDVVFETAVRGEGDTTTVRESPAIPNSAFLEWDAVTHPNLRGYRIYYGPDSDMYLQLPGQGIDVGNVTSYTITGLASGRRYYFAVTAVDYSDNESEYSGQVYKDIP